jgi:abortive infection bacteriophage resistance protein
MEYAKKPTTFEEQADKLLSRGLVADREELLQRLKAVSYYRLSGYL